VSRILSFAPAILALAGLGADGKLVQHFDSGVRPDSVELQQAIEQLLR
jgi:hypothetical protein